MTGDVMKATTKTAMKPSRDLKLRTAVKPGARGPLKALPNMPPRGIETTVKKSGLPGTVTKRLLMTASSSASASNSFSCEEDQALYDEYLLSELMLLNVRKNCQDGKDQGKYFN